MHWRMFSSVPEPHPLDVRSPPRSYDDPICVQTCTHFPWRTESPRLSITALCWLDGYVKALCFCFFSWQKQQQSYYLKCYHCWWKYNEAKKSVLKMQKGSEWGKGSDCVNEDRESQGSMHIYRQRWLMRNLGVVKDTEENTFWQWNE